MAEFKQYITQSQENGKVMISEDVVAAIAEHALADVEGVACVSAKPVGEITDIISKRGWGKGLKIQIADDNTITIDCNINVTYGFGVVDVASVAQTAVASAVESMTGVSVASVNINVCSIVRA